MEYSIINGNREGCKLLWVPQEKYLYVKKCERSGKKTYICYNTILSSEKKKDRKENEVNLEKHIKCTARVTIGENGQCNRNKIAHEPHENHQIIYEDSMLRNNIKKKCLFLRQEFPESSHKISEKEIFFGEICK